jgi:arylsulfatase A-like enzyme
MIYLNEDTAIHPKDITDKGPGLGDSQWDSREMGQRLSAKAVDFITDASHGGRPFFLYYCSPMVHLPHCPPKFFDGKKIMGQTPTNHLDMLLDLDMQIKRIVDALHATDEYDNTLLIITSDNGGLADQPAGKKGHQSNGGWKGNKNSPLEGGHRVPFFAVWPGQITPGITEELVSNQDIIATLAALVGTKLTNNQALDSNNLLPLFTGKGLFKKRNIFLQQAGSQCEVMIRETPYKLIMQSDQKRTHFTPLKLFNLQNDPHEDADLLGMPDYQLIMQSLLSKYKNTVETECPTVPSRCENTIDRE